MMSNSGRRCSGMNRSGTLRAEDGTRDPIESFHGQAAFSDEIDPAADYVSRRYHARRGGDHAEARRLYFDEHFKAGRLLLYGPVLAKEGTFGVGILEVEYEAEARIFAENDPSVLAGLNRFEVSPMRVTATRGKS